MANEPRSFYLGIHFPEELPGVVDTLKDEVNKMEIEFHDREPERWLVSAWMEPGDEQSPASKTEVA